jgi:DNA-binding NtrC family response regulator
MTANDKTTVNGNTAATTTKASIVIVDDEPMVVTSITAFLELDGQFDVFGFTDPAEALRFAQAQRVDVAICDYRMPVLNGLQLLRGIKDAQAETSRILLTSHASTPSTWWGCSNIWKSRGTTINCCW